MRNITLSLLLIGTAAGSVTWLVAQQISGQIEKNPGKPRVAVTDFQGAGAAGPLVAAFNTTVANDLANSPVLNLVPKTSYKLQPPQQPTGLIPGGAPSSAGTTAILAKSLTDCGLPPVTVNYLGMTSGAEGNRMFVAFGWLYSTA